MNTLNNLENNAIQARTRKPLPKYKVLKNTQHAVLGGAIPTHIPTFCGAIPTGVPTGIPTGVPTGVPTLGAVPTQTPTR